MANITIVKTGASVVVNFGDYYPAAPQVDFKKCSYQQADISAVCEDVDTCHVKMRNMIEWLISFDGVPGSFQVDSVNGVTPTDNGHLFDLISALQE